MYTVNRRYFSWIICVAGFAMGLHALQAFPQSISSPKVHIKQHPLNPHNIRVGGDLQTRLELAYSYLVSKHATIPSVENWGADQYGRWLDAVGLLADYLGRSSPEFQEVLAKFLSFQKSDGSILMNKYTPEEWWGTTRAIVFLMEYYSVLPDSRLLQAARQLGDFIVAKAPVESATNERIHGDYHSSLIGLVALYRFTGDEKYLKFAERIASIIDPLTAAPSPYTREDYNITNLITGFGVHGHHTHSYLETMQGIVDLYEFTGDPKYLQMAEGVEAATVRNTMWVSGGIPEVYGEYYEYRDETCPVTSWILLNLRLFRMTGEAKYMDVVETALLNHLFFDQDVKGGFYTYRSICPVKRVSPDNRGEVTDACCSMHGARGMYEAMKYVFSTDGKGLNVNLFVRSEAEVKRAEGSEPIKVHLKTDFPGTGRIELRLDGQPGLGQFAIRIRVPSWVARTPAITVNGNKARFDLARGYAVLIRAWKAGDRVEVVFPFSFSIVTSNHNEFNAPPVTSISQSSKEQQFDDAALLYGPTVLMLDRQEFPQLNWKNFAVAVFQTKDGKLELTKQTANEQKPHQLPDAHFETVAAPYDPAAGSQGGQRLEWQKVTLVPMSEMTSEPVTVDDPYKVRNRVVILPESEVAKLGLQSNTAK